MVPSSLQEKFQITAPKSKDGDDPGGWKTVDTVRAPSAGTWVASHAADTDFRRFNRMPPGMENDNQHNREINGMPMSLAGESDRSKDTNPESLKDGFKTQKMKSTDDQYTGESMDLFYGDVGGFAERNNYLDRL